MTVVDASRIPPTSLVQFCRDTLEINLATNGPTYCYGMSSRHLEIEPNDSNG